MSRTERAAPAASARRSTDWAKVAGIATALVCLAYAPIAATQLWPYARPGAPAWGEWVLARAVNPHYVADAFATRVAPYRHSLVPLVVHTVLGAALMLLGPRRPGGSLRAGECRMTATTWADGRPRGLRALGLRSGPLAARPDLRHAGHGATTRPTAEGVR